MNNWLLASLGLFPPLLLAVIACGMGPLGGRLVAATAAAALTIPLLVTLCFAFGQPSSIDLALTLTVLTLPGTLVLALFVERWL